MNQILVAIHYFLMKIQSLSDHCNQSKCNFVVVFSRPASIELTRRPPSAKPTLPTATASAVTADCHHRRRGLFGARARAQYSAAARAGKVHEEKAMQPLLQLIHVAFKDQLAGCSRNRRKFRR